MPQRRVSDLRRVEVGRQLFVGCVGPRGSMFERRQQPPDQQLPDQQQPDHHHHPAAAASAAAAAAAAAAVAAAATRVVNTPPIAALSAHRCAQEPAKGLSRLWPAAFEIDRTKILRHSIQITGFWYPYPGPTASRLYKFDLDALERHQAKVRSAARRGMSALMAAGG